MAVIAAKHFRPPIVPPETKVDEIPSTSFADLVRLMAEGIADAQLALDRASAELIEELASTTVMQIPEIVERIDKDGTVTYETAKARPVSLLELGVRPTFYQFSQATVEVAMDLRLVESSTESGDGKRRLGLFAETANVRFERKLNRDVSVHSKLTATLVPVPSPLRIDPPRRTEGGS